MNKQELIDYCNAIKENKSQIINCIDVNGIIKKIEQLDELHKVTIPQFVADYIEYAKEVGWNLLEAMKNVPYEDNTEFRMWFYKSGNVEVFARAWLDGYEVKEEKRYIVVMPNVSSTGGVLTRIKHDDSWIWIDTLGTIVEGRTHTRKELDDSWLWMGILLRGD